MNIIDFFLSFIFYILIFVEIFINCPMNGVYRLPGNWTKDSTIGIGLLASFLSAGFLAKKYPLPWYISVFLLILYKIRMTRCFDGMF